MVRVPTRQRSGVTIDLKPIGGDGLNLATDPAMLPPSAMRQMRNIDTSRGTFSSRWGDAKVADLDDEAAAYGAKLFGADSKYAHFLPPLIPLGGFWFKFHLVAAWPETGTRTILSSWTTVDQTEYVIQMTLTDAGVLTVSVRWEDNLATTALTYQTTDDEVVHGLLVYNEFAGTLKLYVAGDEEDSEDVGGGRQPSQDAGVRWYVGVSFKPTVGVDADSFFSGAVDAWTFGVFGGVDPEDEDLTLTPPRRSALWELRREAWQDWPNPATDDVLWHYGFDEETPADQDLHDFSMRQNHGTYVGAVSNAARIPYRAQIGNFVGTTRNATVGTERGAGVNIVVAAGQHFYDIITPGA